MQIWQNYLADRLIFENHPARNDAHCLNTLQTRQPCSICRTVCTRGVFDTPEPRWEGCDNCGLCAAACPARAIAPASIWTSDALDLYKSGAPDSASGITISCRAQNTEADWKLSCLASLPWEVAAMFSIKGTVTLCTAACETCARYTEEPSVCKKQIQQLIKQLKAFLGTERFQKQIITGASGNMAKARKINRREAFSFFAVKSKSAAASLLPDISGIAPDGFFWLRLLAHRTALLHEADALEAPFSLSLPAFTERCSACGRCTKLCPGQALQRIQDDDNYRHWYIGLVPWRCTGCGLCETICPDGGIIAPQKMTLGNLRKPLLHKVEAESCVRCGEPVVPPDASHLCRGCRAEQIQPLVW